MEQNYNLLHPVELGLKVWKAWTREKSYIEFVSLGCDSNRITFMSSSFYCLPFVMEERLQQLDKPYNTMKLT